jgi:preprotein translocase subunit SecA
MKKRRILSKDEFLKYADWSYCEPTPAWEALKSYMLGKTIFETNDNNAWKNEDDETVILDIILPEIMHAMRNHIPLDELAELAEAAGIRFDHASDKENFLSLTAEFYETVRLWGNNGNTPKELNIPAVPQMTVRSSELKIGRNDPCPCGSGKKYKKCCGRATA